MKHHLILAIVVAAIASAAIWGLSPLLADRTEPWDAEGPFYMLALLAAGFTAGAIAPKPLWAHYLGSVGGQLCYELLFLKLGPLFVIGVVFLLGYSLFFLAGACAGARIRVQFSK